jgi:photosystem II stability/assembly factor-like uncharacterized protein
MHKLIYLTFIIVGFLIINKPSNFKPTCKTNPAEAYLLSRQFPYFNEGFDVFQKASAKVLEGINMRKTRGNNNWATEGSYNISGRINTIAVHPTNSDIILVGTPAGGIFKTTDGGATWNPVMDNAATLVIGVIVFDTLNPNIVYAGTGDNVLGGYSYMGAGVYKSTDAGTTWSYWGLKELACISKIVIDPTNSNNVLIAAMGNPFLQDGNRGLYKTSNGGANFTKILHLANDVGIADLAINPTNFNTIYATGRHRIRSGAQSSISGAMARIYKSINGGTTWDTLATGLPAGPQTRIGLAISKQNANKIYALYVDATANYSGIYKSTNGGTNWALASTGSSAIDMKGFGWYFGEIRLNPTNDNTVYVLAVDFFKSTDGGANFTLNAPDWFTYQVHADKHDLQFINASNYLLATDGGLYKTTNGGISWTDLNTMPITQFYEVGFNPFDSLNYYGGAQDNGSSFGNSSTPDTWVRYYGGDGFKPAFDDVNPNIYYTETQNGNVVCAGSNITASLSADRTSWNTPYILDKFNYQQMYIGTYQMYINNFCTMDNWSSISPDLTDGPSSTLDSAFHIISTIAQHNFNANTLYVGTSDANLWITTNGGTNWVQINTGLPNRYITTVAAGTLNNQNVYVGFSGYRNNDSTAYIFKSSNNGNSWVSIAANLPAFSINDIYIHPNTNDSGIAVATDGGVYATNNAGFSWFRVGDNMPIIPVFDLDYNFGTRRLVAGTYARSIQSIPVDSVFKKVVTPSENVATKNIAFNNQFNFFPNPCNNELVLSVNNTALTNYYISSYTGAILAKGSFNNFVKINTTAFLNGNYNFTIIQNNTTYSKQFSVQH